MIRIKQIVIREFRGIRDFTLNIDGNNYAVCGPNGTGKSGIVDAIEFALTGNVSRLAGRGTGKVSLKAHGPHVDCKIPENANVTLKFEIVASGKAASIYRTVENPGKPKVTPTDDDVIAVLEHIKAHPEFVLTRRQLIEFVLSNPGDRGAEVRALLRLDKLETLRTGFQKIAKQEEINLRQLGAEEKSTKSELQQALEIEQYSKSELLQQVNCRRKTLGLLKIKELATDTSFVDGSAVTGGGKVGSRIAKATALGDVDALEGKHDELLAEDFQSKHSIALRKVSVLASEPLVDKAQDNRKMLDVALDIFDEERCPVCDTQWEAEEFRALLQNKVERLETVKQQRIDLAQTISPIVHSIRSFIENIKTVTAYGQQLPDPTEVDALLSFQATLENTCSKLDNLFPLSDTRSALTQPLEFPQSVRTQLATLKAALEALPEPSTRDAARDYLSSVQRSWKSYCDKLEKFNTCQERSTIADRVHKIYTEVLKAALQKIYTDVEATFRNYYRIINEEDESDFKASLRASKAGIDLDVDFYGRGLFPPGAYHSEGHQDGMGLCLYLALMQHLLSSSFTFAVFDDVLMSIDTGHRKKVCELLKQKFPKTQFMLTTHDRIWLKHMHSAGLIKQNSSVDFKEWSVDSGPTRWNDHDVWQEIESAINDREITKAAGLLRHYLEYRSAEVCHRLKAQVVFRGDANYTLGDLLPPSVQRLKKLLGDGIKVANSWQQVDQAKKIEQFLENLDAAYQKSEAENWQVNSAIHYNEWANLDKADFVSVVDAFKGLCCYFECKTCEELLCISGEKSKGQALRCGCNAINFNLLKNRNKALARL